MKNLLPILTITGSDSTGSSGVQADIKTISDFGGYALSAITCLTTRGSSGRQKVFDLSDEIIGEQVRNAIETFHPKVVKVGWIRNMSTVKILRDEIIGCRNIVCSPGIYSSKGNRLVNDATVSAIMSYIVPKSVLLILRCSEAELMLNRPVSSDEEMVEAAECFVRRGAKWVLLRGGRQTEGRFTALLYGEGFKQFFTTYNMEGWQRHGVGGALSSAIATRLAYGDDVPTAIRNAHEYIHSQVVYAVKEKIHSPRSADLYNQFLNIIVDHYQEAHDVAFYANRLAITSRYLSQVTDKTVGKSPKHVIAEYIISEAKSLLDNTRLPIQTIASHLGFSSQAAFCKFFKNHEGHAPTRRR